MSKDTVSVQLFRIDWWTSDETESGTLYTSKPDGVQRRIREASGVPATTRLKWMTYDLGGEFPIASLAGLPEGDGEKIRVRCYRIDWEHGSKSGTIYTGNPNNAQVKIAAASGVPRKKGMRWSVDFVDAEVSLESVAAVAEDAGGEYEVAEDEIEEIEMEGEEA